MVDTVRALAALQALLADNTAGDISAQDVRDFLVSVFPNDDNDHILYALLAGRAGGQVLYGGTGAGDNLQVKSTSNATKGVVRVTEAAGLALQAALDTVGENLTIASGRVTATRSYVQISTEAAAASDNLGSIESDLLLSHHVLFVVPRTSGQIVVLKHNDSAEGLAGYRMFMQDSRDVTLDSLDKIALLVWSQLLDSGAGGWFVLSPTGAPTGADYLVGTANDGLSAEIVVGTTPGGELGGTWASPTVDATHSGSAHHTRSHAVTDTSDHTAGNWKVLYTNGSGQVIELALGANGTFLESNGASSVPGFRALEAADIPARTATMVLTAAAGSPTTTQPCTGPTQVEAGTNDVDYWVLDFPDSGADTRAFWGPILMPDGYDGGTLSAKFVWTAASGSGDVIWGIQMLSVANDEVIDAAYGTAVTVTDPLIATGDVHVSPVASAIEPAGSQAAGELMFIRVYRDGDNASDTLSGTARLIAVHIEFGSSYSD